MSKDQSKGEALKKQPDQTATRRSLEPVRVERDKFGKLMLALQKQQFKRKQA